MSRAVVIHCVRTCVTPGADEGIGRTVALSLFIFLVVTAAFVLPPLARDRSWVAAELVVYLIPQAIPVSLPLAIAFGLAGAGSRTGSLRAIGGGAVVLGIGGILAVLSTMEWLVPAANQAFRTAVASQAADQGSFPRVTLPRGLNERSMSELAAMARLDRSGVSREDGARVGLAIRELSTVNPTFTVQTARVHLHLRVALALAAGPQCLLAAAIAMAIRRRATARLVFAAIAAAYVAVVVEVWTTAPTGGSVMWVWMPNVAITAVAAGMCATRARRQPVAL